MVLFQPALSPLVRLATGRDGELFLAARNRDGDAATAKEVGWLSEHHQNFREYGPVRGYQARDRGDDSVEQGLAPQVVVIRDWTGVRDQKLLFAEPFAGFSFTLKATVVETSRACWRTSIGAPAPALSGPLWCRLAARLVRAWSRCPLVPVPRPLGALGAPLPALPVAPGSLCGAGRPVTLLRDANPHHARRHRLCLGHRTHALEAKTFGLVQSSHLRTFWALISPPTPATRKPRAAIFAGLQTSQACASLG
jgi:hypothetical protein